MEPHDRIRPVMVSQKTCLEALGVNARRFLEVVRLLQIPRTKLGKTVLVEVDDWLKAVRAHREPIEPSQAGTDSVLTGLGFELKV